MPGSCGLVDRRLSLSLVGKSGLNNWIRPIEKTFIPHLSDDLPEQLVDAGRRIVLHDCRESVLCVVGNCLPIDFSDIDVGAGFLLAIFQFLLPMGDHDHFESRRITVGDRPLTNNPVY